MVGRESDDRGTIYKAFLVRIWQDSPTSGWRASAQAVHSGEIVRFASLPALMLFLRTQAPSQASNSEPGQRGPGSSQST